MSLRLRLALAFLLLSVLPLSAYSAYSYVSSKAALRAAAHAEAEATASELEQRVANATADLDRRLRVLSTVPIETWVAKSDAGGAELAPELAELDTALPYLEEIHFVATPPTPPVAPAPAVPPVLPAPPTPSAPDVVIARVPAVEAAPARRAPRARASDRHASEIRAPHAGAPDFQSLRVLRENERQGALFIEVTKLQTAALEAAAAVTRTKGQKFNALGWERMAAQFERRAEEIEAAATAREPDAEAKAEPVSDPDVKSDGTHGATTEDPGAMPSGSIVEKLPSGTTASARAEKAALQCSISNGSEVVGKLQTKIKATQLFHSVLSRVDRRRGEIPFALSDERALIAASDEDAARLGKIPALGALRGEAPPSETEDEWIVVSRQDPSTGYRLGIARPLSGAMAELKRAVARNVSLGLALVGLATVGFFPLTSRLVRNVKELDLGAARIAGGDLSTRVAVAGRDELGRLGASFNRMAEELARHQEQLIAGERRRKEEEISRRLLAAENERRGRELEEARQFQLSLLPRELPRVEGLDLAVEMTTATEVGGDYYDFQTATDGELVLAIGDATGHGAAAGTLVTAVKSLFAAAASTESPAAFLVAANTAIHRMGLVRRAMALTVARTKGTRIVLSAAGMPPVLHYRAAAGAVDELVLPGTPLGSRAEFPYSESEIELAAGDALLFVSDGLPELPNGDGEPFGYERLRAEFGRLAGSTACEIVSGLRAAARDWGGDRPPVDDVTLLAVRRA